jgi:hypothetical protein
MTRTSDSAWIVTYLIAAAAAATFLLVWTLAVPAI